MSDVSAIFGILLTAAIAFPGTLTAWWTLFPIRLSGRAGAWRTRPGALSGWVLE
jgi:hypothetical protein